MTDLRSAYNHANKISAIRFEAYVAAGYPTTGPIVRAFEVADQAANILHARMCRR